MRSYSAEATYSLDDLQSWDRPGTSLAVLGHPVRHSISPQMHNAAIEKLSATYPEFKNWKYFRFEVPADKLVESLPTFHEKGFFGLNLTVPHKEIAFGSIKTIDPAALPIGAINTLRRTEQGFSGYNTDGYGLASGIRGELDREIKNSDIILLGAGGAARAAAVLCLQERCRSLTIVNRNQDRLSRLLQSLEPLIEESGSSVAGKAPSDPLPSAVSPLIINATSLGLKADDPLPIPDENLPSGADCFDMIYNPTQTKLMSKMAEKGGRVANGLSMLIHQGARSLEIWTGKTAPVAVMTQAASLALSIPLR